MALHTCLRRIARANQALVMVECDRRKRRSGNPGDLRSVRTSRRQAYSIVELRQSLRAPSMVTEIRDSRSFGGWHDRPADEQRRAHQSIHCDHDVGGLHHDDDGTLDLDAEIVDRLIGDRGGNDLAIADIDADMRGGRALLDSDDGAFDLVASTDAHDKSHNVTQRTATPRTC